MERAIKLQDVMLRAMAKRITWFQAAEILGISCRQTQRWKTRNLDVRIMNGREISPLKIMPAAISPHDLPLRSRIHEPFVSIVTKKLKLKRLCNTLHIVLEVLSLKRTAGQT